MNKDDIDGIIGDIAFAMMALLPRISPSRSPPGDGDGDGDDGDVGRPRITGDALGAVSTTI